MSMPTKTLPARRLSAAHLGRTATTPTAGGHMVGTLSGLDAAHDEVTVALSLLSGGWGVVSVAPEDSVELIMDDDELAERLFAADLTSQYLGKVVDFGGLSRSYSGTVTGFQVFDRDTVTIILDAGRWHEVEPDCVLTVL